MKIYGNAVGHPLPDPRKGMEMSGPINMNGNRIEGIGNPVDDQDAVPLKVANDLIGTAVGTAKNELSRKLCVPNLLDNSDFTNPVNQRGFVSGSKVNAYGYFIDRWRVGQHDINPIINANGISNISSSEIQQLLDLSLYVGKKLTMVVYSEKNIPMYFCSGVISNNPEWTAIAFSDNWECSLTGQGLNLWAAETRVACKYVALYEGEYTAETLPEYQPKGYANELLACNVSDSGNVSGIKLLWKNASPASAFAAQTISLDLSGYDSVFISCFASNYSGRTDKESHFAIKGEKTTLHSQGSVLANRDVTVSATGLTFTDGVQRPTYGSWTSNTDNHGIVPDKIYGIKGVSA